MSWMWLTVPGALVAGGFGWSFAEYALHNWRGHKGRGKNEFSREHLAHHAKADYFAPTRKKIFAALKTVALLLPLGWLAVGMVHSALFTAGFISMYAFYELLHRRMHTHPPSGFYGRWARKHHFTHHFSRPNHNHGVSSPLWDMVFGTLTPVEVVRVPAKQVMSWLVDPDTGEVYEYLQGDYEIVRRGERRTRDAPSSAPWPLVA